MLREVAVGFRAWLREITAGFRIRRVPEEGSESEPLFFFYIFCKKYRKKPGGGRQNAAPLTPHADHGAAALLRMLSEGFPEGIPLPLGRILSNVAGPSKALARKKSLPCARGAFFQRKRSGSGNGCWNSYDTH